MSRVISQRELRNQSGAIMRALDEGETFIVTRNGVAVGELRPMRRQQFITAEAARAAFAGAPRIDYRKFREDIDRWVDQSPTPRV
jgi:antitoxin (DNA-binding transcriptional repressor) of toxin-antitoxin stability system